MEQKSDDFDMIFLLNQSIQDLMSNSNIDTELERVKFKEKHLNSYLELKSQNKSNAARIKIIEQLLVKLNNLIITKSNRANLHFLQEEEIVCTNRFESKLKLIEISLIIKNKILTEENINVFLFKTIKILRSYFSFLEHNSLDSENTLELFILIKRVLKNILPSTGLNPKLIDEFLIEMIRILDHLNRGLLEKFFGSNPFSSILIGNKYLKCLNLYLDFIEKHAEQITTLAYGKTHLENFFLNLANNDYLAQINQEKTSANLNASFLNDYYIKLVHLSLRVLINFEIIVNEKMKLSDDFFTNLKLIHYKEDIFQLDFIYSSQDDDAIINFNLSCLNYQLQVDKANLKDENLIKELFAFDLNSHVLFVKLLVSIMFDYEILVDWLISNETNFLTYLMRYLKILLNEMSLLKSENINKIFGLDLAGNKFYNFNLILASDKRKSIKNEAKLSGKIYMDKTHQLLIELNTKIKRIKRSFPYNCDPLVKLLDKIENLI